MSRSPIARACSLRGTCSPLDGVLSPHDIDLLGDLAVLVDPAGFGRTGATGQLAVYRFLDSATGGVLPSEQWKLVGRLSSQPLVGANRVRIAGTWAYVGGSLSPQAQDRGKLQANVSVVDLAQPDRPALAASVPFPDARGPNGLALASRTVFAAGGQTILALDISDPRRPQTLAAYKCLDVFRDSAGQDDAHELVYRDGHLYVTGQTTHSFGILRVNDPHALSQRRLLLVRLGQDLAIGCAGDFVGVGGLLLLLGADLRLLLGPADVDRFEAPLGAAAAGADRLVVDLHEHRVGVRAGEDADGHPARLLGRVVEGDVVDRRRRRRSPSSRPTGR